MAKASEPFYVLHVQEFIPREHSALLSGLADRLKTVGAVRSSTTLTDLKRETVWMKKYVAAAMDFWEWPLKTFALDINTELQLRSVGLGWIISICSTHGIPEGDLDGEEDRLLRILSPLTAEIPVDAVARLSAHPWSGQDVKQVAGLLRAHGSDADISSDGIRVSRPPLTISVTVGEHVTVPDLARTTEQSTSAVLRMIETYFNQNDEGASWCAYRRRRLTIALKVGNLDLSQADREFLRSKEHESERDILASHVRSSDTEALVAFCKEKYHHGNVHPRALVAYEVAGKEFTTLVHYLAYLWIVYYTRIWLYLLFEDAYAYLSEDQLRVGHAIEPDLNAWPEVRKVDAILRGLELLERSESGRVESYKPPHSRFDEVPIVLPGIDVDLLPLQYLRQTLIEADTTQLQRKAIAGASLLLRDAASDIQRSLTFAAEANQLRMQRALYVLQLLFIIAGVAQVVALFPIGSFIANTLQHVMSGWTVVESVRRWTSGVIGQPVRPVVAGVINVFMVLAITFVSLRFLRRPAVRRTIDGLVRNLSN